MSNSRLCLLIKQEMHCVIHRCREYMCVKSEKTQKVRGPYYYYFCHTHIHTHTEITVSNVFTLSPLEETLSL